MTAATKDRKDITRSTKTLRAILDASRDALVVVDESGIIALANAGAEKIWGRDRNQFVDRRIQSLFSPQFSFLPFQYGGKDEKGTTISAEGVNKAGDRFLVDVNVRRLEVDQCVYHLLTINEAEVARENQLAEIQEYTFAALERFASGLALEYNNILTGVTGNLDMALEEIAESGRPRLALLESAHLAAERAGRMTRSLLEFAKDGQTQRVSVNLPELIEDNCFLALGDSDVHMEFNFSKDLNAAFVDPGQIGQVVHRLLVSFEDLVDRRHGTILISGRNTHLAEDDCDHWDLLQGEYVEVTLELDGTKPNIDDIEHLFEPYASCDGKTNGLSLSICRAITGRQGGRLSADYSEQGNLVLNILLPASEDTPSECVTSMDSGLAKEIKSKPVNVLVMDDESLVTTMIEMALEAKGHHVTITNDGQDALEEYAEAMARGERYDIVLLDITVPSGMGARTTCQELLHRDPLASCVVMSGDTCNEMMYDYEAYGFIGHLDKPINLDKLVHLVECQSEGGRRNYFSKMLEQELMDEDEDDVALDGDNIIDIDFRPTNR